MSKERDCNYNYKWQTTETPISLTAIRFNFQFSPYAICRRRRSVQVSELFMANIYAVYCAAKQVLFRNGVVICDIFKEIVLYIFKVKILKEVRFSGNLLLLIVNLFRITEARNIH